MKAAVCYEFGKPLVVEEINIDPPKLGEVKVKMTHCAICHSDIHLIRGEWGGEVPVVAGHEGAGMSWRKLARGSLVIQPGDHVVVSLLRSCGECKKCIAGTPHLCTGSFALQKESRLSNKAGDSIIQGISTAAFAEYVVVDQSQLVTIPQEMPLEVAALLACGVITGFGAVVNRAQVPAGSSTVIIGAGGVGLNAIQGAAISGANPIIAVDLLNSKLEAAQEFGATHLVNGAVDDVAARVSEITGGQMADYCFVTVGSRAAAEQAYSLVGHRGMIVFVGIPNMEANISLPVFFTVWSEKMVTGSRMGSVRLSLDVPMLVELYNTGRLKLDELITARYPLEDINTAIESTEAGEALRNMIVF